jgi:hypothetical protein
MNGTPSPHLAATRSDRGFASLPALPDAFGPDAIRVLEASAADGPHLWLRVERPPEPDQSAVAMLTAEQAWQLKEQIEHLLANHYQGDARPAESAEARAERAEAALTYLIRFVIAELDPDPYPDDEHDGDDDSVQWSQYFADPEHEALASHLQQQHSVEAGR